MSVNVKLGRNTINGVNVVKLEDATTSGTYHSFNLATSGMYKVTFVVDSSTYTIVEVVQGNSIVAPKQPTKSGYQFISWQVNDSDISFPYTPVADTTITAHFVAGETCTVAGLGSSSPSSVTFTKSAGWSDTYEKVTINGNTFIKFPTMWRKVNNVSNNQITSFTIATAQIDNTYEVYPCFLKEDGVSIMPYVLMGVSCSNSNTVCNSVDGYTGSSTQTIDVGRNNARSLGDGYQIMDWMIFDLWQDLLICKMETINTNSGSGITTDSLGIYWGSNYPWIDGITHNGSDKTFLFSYKPSKYVNQATVSTDGYQSCGYTYSGTSGQEISKLGYNATHPFFNYPTATTSNSSYNSYYCDAFYFGTSGTNPVSSSVGNATANNGAFRCDAVDGWSGTYGVRLCYRPISE